VTSTGEHDERERSGEGLQLHRWLTAPVVSLAVLVMIAGFGQFGAVAALADVASELGATGDEDSIADQAGLSGTALGIGLAIIRLASILSLPLAGLADALGRRSTLLWFCGLGLLVTASAALSPTYWWFVAIFALSRPLLTATDTVATVAAAEQTGSTDRAKAIALVAAGYGVGAGLIAVVRGVGADTLGFRGVFALALLPLVAVPFVARRVREPDRYRQAEAAEDRPMPVLGAVGARFRKRLGVLMALTFAVAVVTGPANSFIFLYVESVLGSSPGASAAMVVSAGPAGLVGLLAGRWAADTVGRRGTCALGLALLAVAGVVTYSGSFPAAVAGYLGAVVAGSVFAPGIGAFVAELFPTEVRGAVAGWTVAAGVVGAVVGLMAFGALADAHDEFGLAAALVFVPAALCAALLVLLPETKGRELEDWEAAR
jgi:MFS family permease